MDDQFVLDPTEEDDHDGDEEPEDDEEMEEVRFKAYERHLPDLQETLRARYGELRLSIVTDKAEKLCAVCPTIQRFKGWKALLAHAETFKRKKMHQHRGYGDAIRTALAAHGASSLCSQVPSTSRTAAVSHESKHLIVWPPLVVVKIADAERRLCRVEVVWHALREEFPGLQLPRVVAIEGMTALLVFTPEAVGYLEAKMVSERFAERKRGFILKCYLATPKDMRRIDPERNMVIWAEESFYLKVQQAQRKEKEEHDNEKARLKAMELKVENLADDELKFKKRKRWFETLITSKQKEVEIRKRKADDLEKFHADELQRLKAKFEHDMQVSEDRRTWRLRDLRVQLQRNEARMEEELVKRMKEIESLQQQFQAVTKDIKQKEAQKAMKRELEVMQRKERFMAGLAKAEALFNENMRRQESLLQEQQHHEQMQLMEEAKQEREQLLQEWLAKQEKVKSVKEEPRTEKEQECYYCMEPLTLENRAYFNPCGHARICLECAIEVYEQHGSCPECRKAIDNKPVLLGRVYM